MLQFSAASPLVAGTAGKVGHSSGVKQEPPRVARVVESASATSKSRAFDNTWEGAGRKLTVAVGASMRPPPVRELLVPGSGATAATRMAGSGVPPADWKRDAESEEVAAPVRLLAANPVRRAMAGRRNRPDPGGRIRRPSCAPPLGNRILRFRFGHKNSPRSGFRHFRVTDPNAAVPCMAAHSRRGY